MIVPFCFVRQFSPFACSALEDEPDAADEQHEAEQPFEPEPARQAVEEAEVLDCECGKELRCDADHERPRQTGRGSALPDSTDDDQPQGTREP